MLHAVIEGIFGFLIECLFALLWWIILFPVVWLLALPFVLILALFGGRPYSLAVIEMLVSVHCFWKKWGIMIVP